MHVADPPPVRIALTVTVSPSTAPTAEIAGVVSFVTLSVEELPKSDEATRSGVPADVAVSIVIGNAGDDGNDTLPARSVCTAVISQVPSDKDPRSHDVAGRTYEQDTGVEPALEAVIVTVSPFTAPTGVADMVGVLSLVRLSVLDVPRSEAAARSTADGALGALRSTVTDAPGDDAPGPVPPADLVTAFTASVGTSVPSSQPDTVIVYVVVDTADTEKLQPVAVPAFVKSVDVNVEPSIASEKTIVYEIGFVVLVGDDVVVVKDVTAKATYRTMTMPEPPAPATVLAPPPKLKGQ